MLKPGGRFIFNVWDRLEENEVSRVVADAVAALFPEDPPEFLARVQGSRMRNRRLSGRRHSKIARLGRRSEGRPFPNRSVSWPSSLSYRGDLMREPWTTPSA